MNDPRAPQRPRGLQPFPPIGWWPALAIVAAAATSYAWIRPADHDVTAQRPYSTTYHFDYTANVPGSNVVYEQDALEFGDPVFRNIVDAVDVSVEFTVDSPGASVSGATLTTKVVVSSDAGWARTLDASDAVPFDGDSTSASIHVDFAAAERLASKVATAAGVEGKLAVTVFADVNATVLLPGDVDGGSEHSSATVGSLVFDLDPTRATLRGYTAPNAATQPAGTASASDQTGGSGTTTASKESLATQSIVGTVSTTFSEPVTMNIGRWDVKIKDLRLGTEIALGFFLLLCLYNWLALFLAGRKGEANYLTVRYGAQIFPLMDVPDVVRDRAVWVGSFEALAAAAANAEADILHQDGVGNDWYYVFDGPTVFAYVAVPTSPAVATAAAQTQPEPDQP